MRNEVPLLSAEELSQYACGLPHIRAMRNKIVTARRTIGGESIITLTETLSGRFVSEVSTTPEGANGFIVTYSIEGKLSSHFMEEAEFLAEYEPAGTGANANQIGAAYLPRQVRHTMLVVDRSLRFKAANGTIETVLPGGVLIPYETGFVSMNPKAFAATHSVTHSRQDARKLLPSQEGGSRLFASWLEVEGGNRAATEILQDLNNSCGTKYQHGWLSRMRSDPARKGERIPREVRAYMMTSVLKHELGKLGIETSRVDVPSLVERML